jgi:hypothetical protein
MIYEIILIIRVILDQANRRTIQNLVSFVTLFGLMVLMCIVSPKSLRFSIFFSTRIRAPRWYPSITWVSPWYCPNNKQAQLKQTPSPAHFNLLSPAQPSLPCFSKRCLRYPAVMCCALVCCALVFCCVVLRCALCAVLYSDLCARGPGARALLRAALLPAGYSVCIRLF